MAMNVAGQRFHRRNLWLHPLVQLGLAALAAVAAPYIVQLALLPEGWRPIEAQNTAFASLAGLVVGFWLHRSVSNLPGMRESSSILPAYLASFGLVLTVILLLRVDYSRANLILGFGLSIAWFFLVYVLTQRKTKLSLGVVEGGRVDLFDEMEGVESFRLRLDEWPDGVDAVTADFRHDHSAEWEARLADLTLAGIPVFHSKDLYESLTGRADLEHLSENNFGALGPLKTVLGFKLVVDWLIALPTLVLLLPLFAVTAVAIRLDTAGPVFFRQARTGYRGRDFTVVKFRTMRESRRSPREETGTPSIDTFITRANDRRITRVGRFLRRTRIDELPQVINILRGEMSWIGPRPEASRLSAWYEAEIPFYRYRHVVRPGITGWAQVNQGHVAEVEDIRTKLQYDFYYIRNFSVWLDLVIVMKTAKTMLTGFGHK
jgi:lipopolysaccharide/colanic/teichoic acid biosynthesis glycosyltransferase